MALHKVAESMVFVSPVREASPRFWWVLAAAFSIGLDVGALLLFVGNGSLTLVGALFVGSTLMALAAAWVRAPDGPALSAIEPIAWLRLNAPAMRGQISGRRRVFAGAAAAALLAVLAFLAVSVVSRRGVPLPTPIATKAGSAAQPVPSPAPALAVPAATSLVVGWQSDLASVAPGARPNGLVLGKDGSVFVADTGLQAVEKLDSSGKLMWTAKAPAGESIGYPVDVAFAKDGSLLALDPEAGLISRISMQGEFMGHLAPSVATYAPRGLASSAAGDIYIANTGQGNIVHLDSAGKAQPAIDLPKSDQGTARQPIGITVAANGDLFVIDPIGAQILRVAAGNPGQVSAWAFVGNPTSDGPHLAVGPDGSIWASDSQSSRIYHYNQSGKIAASYTAPGLSRPAGLGVSACCVVVTEPAVGRVISMKLSS